MSNSNIYQLSAIVLLFALIISNIYNDKVAIAKDIEFEHQLNIRDSVNNRNKAINDSLQIVIETNQPLFKNGIKKSK